MYATTHGFDSTNMRSYVLYSDLCFRFCILKIKEKKFFGLFINHTQKNKFYLRPTSNKTRVSTFMF